MRLDAIALPISIEIPQAKKIIHPAPAIQKYPSIIEEVHGFDVPIIDSLTHGWQELLEEINRITKASYRLHAGVFRLVCPNGSVIADTVGRVSDSAMWGFTNGRWSPLG